MNFFMPEPLVFERKWTFLSKNRRFLRGNRLFCARTVGFWEEMTIYSKKHPGDGDKMIIYSKIHPGAGDKKRFYSKKSSNKENENPQLPKNFESSKEKFLRPKKINSLWRSKQPHPSRSAFFSLLLGSLLPHFKKSLKSQKPSLTKNSNHVTHHRRVPQNLEALQTAQALLQEK